MYLNYRSFIKSSSLRSYYKENSEVLFLNSSFCFKNPYTSEKFFKFSTFYNIYSRFSNPTLNVLEKKISSFEKNKYCLSFSSGMAAIFSIFVVFLKPGDSFSSPINLFGATINFFLNFLFKFNILIFFLDFSNLNSFYCIIFYLELFFFETPSNPLIKFYDILIISYLSLKYNIILFIDNTFSTPILQNFNFLNVDFILHSCTKFFDGQGRVLGGVVLTNKNNLFLNVFSFLRFSGFKLAVFDSWLIFKSLDHLFIRVKYQIYNSFFFLKLFKYNLYIFKIFYSGFLGYWQYKIFFYNQINWNSIFSFIVKGNTFEMSRMNSWILFNNLFFMNTSNLGDIKSIITNCSITTHSFLNFIEKIFLKIFDSLLRLSLGLEDIFDLYYSLILNFNYI